MKTLSLICFSVFTMISYGIAFGASPEATAVKQYIKALSSGKQSDVSGIMCQAIQKADQETQVLMLFLVNQSEEGAPKVKATILKSAPFLLDLSQLNYQFIDRDKRKTTAIVKVSGPMRAVNLWKSFEVFLRDRNRSNLAAVVNESGRWKFCGFLTVRRAIEMSRLYSWNIQATPSVQTGNITSKEKDKLKIAPVKIVKVVPKREGVAAIKVNESEKKQSPSVQQKPVVISLSDEEIEKLNNVGKEAAPKPQKDQLDSRKQVAEPTSKIRSYPAKPQFELPPINRNIVKPEQVIVKADFSKLQSVDIDFEKRKQENKDSKLASQKNIELTSIKHKKEADERQLGEVLYQDFSLGETRRWVVVASRENPIEAKKIAREHLFYFPTTQVVQTDNGWYAVVVGNLPMSDAVKKLQHYKDIAIVPKDSFLSKGGSFVKRYWASKVLIKAEQAFNSKQ